MADMKSSALRRYWIFQGVPGTYDIERALESETTADWPLTRFEKTVGNGDIVYLWRGGGEAALVGWGEVTGDVYVGEAPPAIKKSAEKAGETVPATVPRIEISYRQKLLSPLEKRDLSDEPELRELTIIRNNQGTNFRVTTLEALALNRLIEETTTSPPPSPEEAFGPDSYLSVALSDYRYSGTPAQIVNAAAMAASYRYKGPQIDPLLMLGALGAVVRILPGDRDDTTAFVRGVLEEAGQRFFSILPKILDIDANAAGRFLDPSGPIPPRSRTVPELNSTFVTLPGLRLMARARRAAVQTTGQERIRLRHLVAAVLMNETLMETPEIDTLLAELGTDASRVRARFLEFVKARFQDKRAAAWDLIFETGMEKTPIEGLRTVTVAQMLAKLNADDPRGTDRLKMTDEVNAFGTVLAAKDVSPPLAVGVFGDWGSGKTFFMRKVHDRVSLLAGEARESLKRGETSAFCGHIMQIWFNAWHYVEANLWASLVDHIFQHLKSATRKDTGEDTSFDNLIEELGLSKEQIKSINERLVQARKRRKNVRRKRNDVLKKINSRNKGKRDLLAAPLLCPDEINGFMRELNPLITKAKEALGVDGSPDAAPGEEATLQSLFKAIHDAGLVASRSYALWRSLTRSSLSEINWKLFGGLTGLIVVGSFVATRFFAADVWSAWMAVMAEIGAVVGVGLRWVRPKLKSAFDILDRLEGFQQKVNARAEDAETRRRERLEGLERELDRMSQEVLAVENDFLEAQQEVEKIEAELKASAPERLVRFITERASSEDYRKHLGLLALIRKDFDKLSILMKKQLDEKERKDNLPAIERIVLYIDDLDRCPPKRVVDVLQAIHLLLAFPLFIVVVGVDSRWVSRSLRKHYLTLLYQQETPEKELDGDIMTASTQDYLEKIFQIPFWLKPMDPNVIGDLVGGLIDSSQRVAQEGLEKGEEGNESALGSEREDREEGEGEIFGEEEASEDEEDGKEAETIDLNPAVLQFTRPELEYMGRLGVLMGRTPRSVKRFVNIYRLLKASHVEAQTPGFLGSDREFRGPLFLFAVMTGHPRAVRRFFSVIFEDSTNGSIAELRKSLPTYDDRYWERLTKALEAFDEQSPPDTLEVSLLKIWLPHVVRFSYQEWRY